MLVQEPLQAAIWHCLNHYAYKDAIFLAERLHAEVKSEDSLFLLATCYYRANKRNQCYAILRAKSDIADLNPRCRYLLSLCCVDMNKMPEAERLIKGDNTEKNQKDVIGSVVKRFGDSAPFACQLLGKIHTQATRTKEAHDAYVRSLKLNPFLWESFDSICQSGENINPETVFQTSHLDSFSMCHGTQTVVSLVGNQTQEPVVMGVCNLNSTDIHPKFISTPMHPRPTLKAIPIQTPDEANVLHPSNKNRAVKSTRTLFTSTPMAVNNTTTFGCLPLLESSNESFAQHSISSPFMLISPAPLQDSSEPRSKKASTNSAAFQELEATICHHRSPYASPSFLLTPPNLRPTDPRFRKPCLRVPPSWQQQQQASSILTTHSPSPVQTPPPQQPLNPQTANVRRSSRLFSNSNVSVKENSKTPARSRVTPSKSPNRKNKLRSSKASTVTSNNNTTYQENQKNSQLDSGDILPVIETEAGGGDFRFVTPPCDNKMVSFSGVSMGVNSPQMAQTALSLQKQSAEGLMFLLRQLGKAYLLLCRYECKEALLILTNLSSQHANTGWVLGTKAKALFEMGNYDEAVKTYNAMRTLEPYRVEGLEWFSTALWHLQQEIELSALAHDLITSERQEAATWITAGNCFSLNKEHETAIKFFERAIQVDSNCAYGYTLLGHEYVAIEELDRALKCFRTAIRINARHYNAWYGLGMIYYKQERYQRAENYYNRALNIHPNNSVLLCHLAVAQHALNKPEKSLASFSRGLVENPSDPLCKFHRASVLFALGRLDEALKELEELKYIVPKESLVYFLIAKIYSKKGETHQALLHFSWATDLDPKGANNQIKESIEPVLSRSLSTAANIAELRDSDSNDDSDADISGRGETMEITGEDTLE